MADGKYQGELEKWTEGKLELGIIYERIINKKKKKTKRNTLEVPSGHCGLPASNCF